LSYLAGECNLKVHPVELYHQPLNPDRLQTLVIEGLKIAVTVNPKMEARAYKIIDLDNPLKSLGITIFKTFLYMKIYKTYFFIIVSCIKNEEVIHAAIVLCEKINFMN